MQLTVSLVRAVRADERPQHILAKLAGWKSRQPLVDLLTIRAIPNTPLQRARVAQLAEAIGYDGPIFVGGGQ